MRRGPKINPIRKAILKKNLLSGDNGKPLDAKNSMLRAGYSYYTARNATQKRCVQECMSEIANDIMRRITPENVLAELAETRAAAFAAGDYSAATRCTELVGKYLALWRDRVDTTQQINVTAEERAVLDRYAPNRLSGIVVVEAPKLDEIAVTPTVAGDCVNEGKVT